MVNVDLVRRYVYNNERSEPEPEPEPNLNDHISQSQSQSQSQPYLFLFLVLILRIHENLQFPLLQTKLYCLLLTAFRLDRIFFRRRGPFAHTENKRRTEMKRKKNFELLYLLMKI